MGDDVRRTDLARELDVTKASLVRILDHMVAAKLADRCPDETDGRVSRVRLRDKGRSLVARIEEVFTGIRKDMLVGIGDTDLRSAILVAEHLQVRFLRERNS